MKTLLPFLIFTAALLLYSCNQERTAQKPRPVKKALNKIKPPPPPVKTIDTLTIAAVGDIMLGTSYPDARALPPDSGKNSFKGALDELRNADVTFGNLEGTIADTGKPASYKMKLKSKAYLFRMPVYFAGVLKDAGFKIMSLANNHIGDFGDYGRKSTIRILDSVGINFGGQLDRPSSIFTVNGVTFGFCAFAPNSNTLSLLDLKKAEEIIRALKGQCQILIVSFHGGAEGAPFEHVPFKMESYLNEKRGDVHAFAHNAIDAGADLVFGNGPHVCRAMELYNNRLIAYSLGNFCTYRCVSVAGVCGYAPLVKIKVNKKGEFLEGQIKSYRQTHLSGLIPDSLNLVAKRIKILSETDFPESAINISQAGSITKINLNQ